MEEPLSKEPEEGSSEKTPPTTPKVPSIENGGVRSNPAFSKFSNAEEMSGLDKPNTQEPKGTGTSNIQRIRTFKSDIADAMNKQNASLVSIAAAEQERRGGTPQQSLGNLAKKKSKISIKKIFIVILGIIFVFGGIGILGYILFFHKKEAVVIVPDVPSLIFTDNKQEIDATSKDARTILQTLTDAKESVRLSLGDIEQLYIITRAVDGTPNVLSSQDLLSNINARVTDSFVRSLGKIFTLGVHVFDGNQPFILFTTNSYENTFAGMLAWEETMQGTFAPLFGATLPPAFQELPETSTSTPSRTLPVPRAFQDRVIRNIDSRVLVDASGKIVLLYAFPSQHTLIITTNEQTLAEVTSRLNSTRVF